ncbi:MAG: hypothetical protein A2Y12_19400 [Planctomycetes bacterium GWF2_42_9]|nr:MAG: hypothetical protein A2Y12_19400 [Planctomycetes bacterium GWF2_42_9]HAL45659.1 hypothetical protein [Phycisphaerales bacterium]
MDRFYHKLILTAAAAVLAFLAFYLFASSMSKSLTSDENMYCTGGILISKGMMLYRDFPYATQLPYHPLLCGLIYKLTGTTHYLLAARLISVAFDILIIYCIFSIIRKIFADYFYSGVIAGLAGAAIFVFNPFAAYLCGLAWNQDMTLLCIILSFRIFMGISPATGAGTKRIFIIAALLTIAAWTRATSVFVFPVFLIMIEIASSSKKNGLLAMTFGMIIFSIVPLWILIESGRAFFVNVFTISMLHGQLLHQLHIANDKFYLTISVLRNIDYLLLILTAFFLGVYVCFMLKKIIFPEKRNGLLSFLLLFTMIGIAYFPPTMWKQYFGMPVAFVIITSAYSVFYLRTVPNKIHFKIAISIFAALAIFTAVNQKPIVKIAKVLKTQNWTPIKIHNISKNIVAKTGRQPILTLSPLYALEGNGQIYIELAAGVPAFRVADKLTETDRKITHTAGLRQIPQILTARPASAIVIGPELTRFDKIDLKSLVPDDWQKVDCGDSSVHIFMPKKQ